MKKYIIYFTMVVVFLFASQYTLAAPVTVDSQGDVGGYTSMAIVYGKPAISYYDATNGALKYARALNSSGSRWGRPITMDYGSLPGVGAYTSMVTLMDSRPAISYYDSHYKNLKYVRAKDLLGNRWYNPILVAHAGDVGKYASMAIVYGKPAIAYYDSTHKVLKYVRAKNSSGTSWYSPVTVDSAGAVGKFVSMIMIFGRPAIAYFDSTHKDLKYVRARNQYGSAWFNPVKVDSTGDVGAETSLAVVSGRPAITYYDYTHTALKYVRARNSYGSAWFNPVTVDSTGNVGMHTSLVDINGSPAIAYYDYTHAALKYVRARNQYGSAWFNPVTVDNTGAVGMYTSLADIDGNPAIAYYDRTHKDLKYAILPNLYFPHIASNSKWETEICIINTSSISELTGHLKAYNDMGGMVQQKSVKLASHGRESIIISNEFSDPSSIGYIIFESDSASICGYTKFHVNGKYRVAIPAIFKINKRDILVPHIASNNKWWTGLSLVNTRAYAKTISIKFNDNTTKFITLGAGEHKKFSIASMFGNHTQSQIKSAVIRNTAGVIGLELFGSTPGAGKNYLSGILLKDQTSRVLYYSHIASNAKWWTGIVAYNPYLLSTNLTIKPYKSDGTLLPSQTMVLKGEGKYVGTASQLNLPQNTAWFLITADRPVTGFELFGKNNGKQLAGYTVVNIDSTSGVFPKLEKDGWTGIAFVNPWMLPTMVIMDAFNDSGTKIATKSILLKKYEKKLGIAEALFKPGNIANATYITYRSSKPIVGFQLNGSTDDMLLDALPGK